MAADEKCIRFSKAAIEALPLPQSGRVEYQDTKVPGLHLRVAATGVRTFSVFKRVKGGDPARVTLGRFPDLTVENARRDAAQILAAIASGANPAASKRALRDEMVFGELFQEYLQRHARVHKKTASEDEQRYRQYLERPLGNKKISSITRQMIGGLHASITASGHPVVANRVLALVSSIFGRGVEWSITENNPAKGIRRNPEKSRDRFIQTDEMAPYFQALFDEPNTTVRDYIMISLLTGARRANVLVMMWRDVSFTDKIWRVSDTKNGIPQNIPLSAEVVEILAGRKEAFGTSEFVFPGGGETGHLVEPRKGAERIRHRAAVIAIEQRIREAGRYSETVEQIRRLSITKPAVALAKITEIADKERISIAGASFDDLRIHDLRRTFGSFQAKTGASLAIIGKSLNHKSQQTTAIYARLDLDPVRESVNTATVAMLQAAGLRPLTEVEVDDPPAASTESLYK
ncbi:site-specific integrase [Dechloromonas sp. H13]|uniref:tyrosine-type recombinase/integrase n=1 Tax=Dechloromonas sp. H13 TaxID=2570193 RepID=UPI00129146B1|nr:site-specific integrase [Dechloromonas sp. H13]